MTKWLRIRAGARAREQISRNGFRPDDFGLMVGASGGPKWLSLSRMDRVWVKYLVSQRTTPLDFLGSSIGAFRHTALCQAGLGQKGLEKGETALETLEAAYIAQSYDENPNPQEVGDESRVIVQALLGRTGAQVVAHHPLLRNHVVTVRGRGLAHFEQPKLLGAGLALTAGANVLGPNWQRLTFERVVFSVGPRRFSFRHLPTRRVEISESNLEDAILASGSIPLLMSGVSGIAGAPKGRYRDGGITDYHFDFSFTKGPRLVLFPHFFGEIHPGWFDKFLPWRKPGTSDFDNVLMVYPSRAMVNRLPYRRIPDRKDFYNYDTKTRQRHWITVIDECRRMADELEELIVRDRFDAALQGGE